MKKNIILILLFILLIIIIVFFIIGKNRLKQPDVTNNPVNQTADLATSVASSSNKQQLSNNAMNDIESAIKEKLKN